MPATKGDRLLAEYAHTPHLQTRSSGAVVLSRPTDRYNILAFVALHSKEGDLRGWLVGLSRSDEPMLLDRSVQIGLSFAAALLIGLGLSGWWLYQSRRTLKTANLEMERALKAEQQFIASMSHEMRTPLNSIIGYQDLLLSLPLDADTRRYVERANRSAEHLLSLIGDILDLSKLHAGKLELNEEPIDIPALIEECRSIIAPNIRKGVLFEVGECPAEHPLLGDAMRLRQILLNLLSNAAKFTHQGAITVHCRVNSFEKGRCSLIIEVRDTGIGIAPDRLQRLFKPFKRAHGTQYAGSGLGLFLARNLAEQMGGSLEASSIEDRGSTFTLTLYLPYAPDQRAAP